MGAQGYKDAEPKMVKLATVLKDFIFNLGLDLKLVLAFTAITLAFFYLPIMNGTVIRSALGLVMILFVPGYTLAAALFPGKDALSGLERGALSIGLSAVIVSFIGFGLNFTTWGIRLWPIAICLSIFIAICLVIANIRRYMLTQSECFSIDLSGSYQSIKKALIPPSTSKFDRELTVMAALILIPLGVAIAYLVIAPVQERYTDLYLLGPGGQANDYPTLYTLGDKKPIIVGIMNHENKDIVYDLIITLNNSSQSDLLHIENIAIDSGQRWEKTIQIEPTLAGNMSKIVFSLYNEDNLAYPYRECYLWINVTTRDNMTANNSPLVS